MSCPEHGVRQVRMPWAEAGSRFTHLFEALAIDILLATNVKRAAEILRITWDCLARDGKSCIEGGGRRKPTRCPG
ncbi:helix-turn-helix domain-containing protein [Cupriavidus sp. CuC1]|uniref:helix-turn-helix domain-containing protein n=1 Tax=Cupriavidus sp. CuC1 TaxID=3373131 RepID=UPI0037D05AF6